MSSANRATADRLTANFGTQTGLTSGQCRDEPKIGTEIRARVCAGIRRSWAARDLHQDRAEFGHGRPVWCDPPLWCHCALLRRRRKRRQFVDVARIVLNDDGRLEVRRDLLEALDRCQRLGAIEVERGHAGDCWHFLWLPTGGAGGEPHAKVRDACWQDRSTASIVQ